MPTNIEEIIAALSPAQRKKAEARAAQLIAEEMTLRELRHARKLTQARMAKALGITQDSVSRLEKRSDLLLSTLRKTVGAMGGNLPTASKPTPLLPFLYVGWAGRSRPLDAPCFPGFQPGLLRILRRTRQGTSDPLGGA